VTADGRWLTISATTGTDPSTDIWLADLARSSWRAPALRPVQEGVPARTRLIIGPGTGPDDPMWLLTTEGAPCGRIMTATAATLDGTWRELIAERPGAVLTDFAVLTSPELPGPRALVAWTRHSVGEITVHDLADGTERGQLAMPGIGTVMSIGTRRDAARDAWFTYVDHHTPATVLLYDGRTNETRPWFFEQMTGPGEGVHTRQVSFESRDGTTVRMFVVSPEGRPDRPRPTILTGYGGFGVSMTPGYSSQTLAWVRAGGVFAIACLRGGGEEGREWHLAGRRENKQNVFDDFAAAADHLVEAGWTTSDRLGILGGSNGGLLVGAAVTQNPGRYAAVVCLSPLLDMARYELSGLGPSWRREYGSADDPADFRVLLSYSPYHRVDRGTAYPAVLFGAAEGDTRVDPMHAGKMCAALQHASSGHGPVLLRYERDVGHADRALSRSLDLQADFLAFFARHLGLDEPGDHLP
jgi:prolyl oligopeptidase